MPHGRRKEPGARSSPDDVAVQMTFAQAASLLLLRGLPGAEVGEVVAALGGSRFLNALLPRVTNNELRQIMLEAQR